MAKIVIEISGTFHLRKELRQFDAQEIRIGRGYGCDLIIQDPYVSDCHMILRFLDGRWVVEDRHSRNGVFVFQKTHHGKRIRRRLEGEADMKSGDIFVIGQTRLRVFAPDHPVPSARRTESQGTLLKSINNPMNLWYAIAGVFCLYYVQALFDFEQVEISNGQILFGEILFFLLMIIWAGLWAFVGRIIRHRARFALHLTMVCFFAICAVPIVNTAEYAGFILGSMEGYALILSLGLGTALTLLLMGHEAAATFLSLKARIFFSALVPIGCGVLAMIGFVAFQSEFLPIPVHFINLKPPIVRPFFVSDEEKFLSKVSGVFETAGKLGQ